MKRTSARPLLFLLPILSLATAALFSQTTKTSKGFVIDENKPFVYVRFEHIGPGAPRSGDEPPTRIWLRLINNCRVPIVVRANGVPDESPKDELGLEYDVVTNRPVNGLPILPDEPQESDSDTREVPRGYLEEVASTQTIGPNEKALFSVPVNHLGKRWHIEIPFTFEVPSSGKCCRDEKDGGQPVMYVDYGLYDLPPHSQNQIPTK